MHTRQLIKTGLLVLMLTAVASAADITGNWKADLETPQGMVQVNYTFKQEGAALTGTWQAAQSPTVSITDGKVTGDKVTFVVKVGPNGEMTFAHEGTVKGDEIQLAMKPSGEFPGATVVAKRVKP
jgi:autotransporter translocation and assembly factor TamB